MTTATENNKQLIEQLKNIAGQHHVLTGEDSTYRFTHGFRFGAGKVLAVVQPGSLIELWRVAQACVNADKIIIMQAANTGLTGGSTPMVIIMTAISCLSARYGWINLI